MIQIIFYVHALFSKLFCYNNSNKASAESEWHKQLVKVCYRCFCLWNSCLWNFSSDFCWGFRVQSGREQESYIFQVNWMVTTFSTVKFELFQLTTSGVCILHVMAAVSYDRFCQTQDLEFPKDQLNFPWYSP